VRDIVLILGTLFYLPVSLMAPAAGLLCWEWFSIMSPQRQVFGFAWGQPLNSVVAVATLLGWLLSRERKRMTPDVVPWLMLAWLVWMTLSSAAGQDPDQAWSYWDRVTRTLVPVFLCFVLMTTKARIHAMIWVLVISLGYYGVKGGAFTIVTGGHNIVWGPPSSMISDNNQLAAAIVMGLPLVFYLWQQTANPWLRHGLIVAMALQVLMVFGSYSRGGVIALAVMLTCFWLRSDRKFVYGIIGVLVIGVGLSLMPPSFWNRLHTLNDVNADSSFQGRVMAWRVAVMCATEYFPFGAGFLTPQMGFIWTHFQMGEDPHAAHRIYFQVLGEHGFIGLAIYVPLLLLPLRNASIVIRQCRNQPGLEWARDLAEMMRISLIAFYVGGAALSLAYFDGYLVVIALASCLRELTAPERLLGFKQPGADGNRRMTAQAAVAASPSNSAA